MQSPRNSKERNDDGGDDDNDDITSNCSLFAEMVSWLFLPPGFKSLKVLQGQSNRRRSIDHLRLTSAVITSSVLHHTSYSTLNDINVKKL